MERPNEQRFWKIEVMRNKDYSVQLHDLSTQRVIKTVPNGESAALLAVVPAAAKEQGFRIVQFAMYDNGADMVFLLEPAWWRTGA